MADSCGNLEDQRQVGMRTVKTAHEALGRNGGSTRSWTRVCSGYILGELVSTLYPEMWWEAESKASRLVSPENISEQLGMWRVTCLSVTTFSHV